MKILRRQRATDSDDRLQRAESASEVVDQQGEKVEDQLGLVDRLVEGWKIVHSKNHLAQIFKDEGHLG